MKKTLFVLFLCFIFHQMCGAFDWSKYKIQAINDQEHLPTKQIKQIYKDNDGYMWFATTNGLCQYNGYELKVYKSSYLSPALLHSNIVNAVVEDNDKRIWIGTAQGINILDKTTGKVEAISNDSISNNYIRSLLLSKDGTIWIGTQAGLLRYNKENNTFTTYKNRPNDKESICGNTVRSLLEDTSGNIWIATWEQGICCLNPETEKFTQYPFPTLLGRMSCLFEDQDQVLWIGAWADGVIKMKDRNPAASSIYTPYTRDVEYEYLIYSLQQLPEGMLAGTNLGITEVDASGKLIPVEGLDNPAYSRIVHDEINHLYYDNNHILWIATENSGVYIAYKNQSPFTNYPLKSEGNLDQPVKVNALFEWNADELLLGVDKIGLALYNKKTHNFSHYRETPALCNLTERRIGNIQFIFKHPFKEELWLGSEYAGLFVCQLKENKIASFVQHFPHKGYWFMDDVVNSIVVDKDSNIWIGANNGLNIITSKDTLSYKNYYEIQSIYEDCAGDIWMGTCYDGVYRVKAGSDIRKLTFEIYNCDNMLINSNDVKCIYEDSRKNLWAGTKGGGLSLYNRKKNRFELVQNMSDIPGDIIFNIVEYNSNLILGTNMGLVLYTPKTEKEDSNVLIFNNKDELLDNTCVRSAVLKTKHNELFYGTPKGFYNFKPSMLKYDSLTAKTVIADFKVFHTSFDDLPLPKQKRLAGKFHPLYSKSITLTPDDNNIGIEFATLSYLHPEKNRYVYKLEGFDCDWVYTDATHRTAYYTNLPAGNYRFLVRGINENEIQNITDEVLYIKVLPPFYRSNMAYGCYFLLILGIVYLFYRFLRYRFRLNEALKIEQIERVKSEELNQSKFRFFTNISHEFLTPLSIISCSVEEIKAICSTQTPAFQAVKANLYRLNKLIEEILEFQKAENNKLKLKVSYGNIASFISGICYESFALLIKNKSITLQVDCVPKSIAAWFDQDKIDKIMYNLLSNAVKFTFTDGSGVIKVTLLAQEPINEFQNRYLTIRVKNTGKGIAADKLPYIFTRFYDTNYKQSGEKGNGIGLALTKSLVELHNGTITVSSLVDECTEFVVTIPISKDAFTDNQIDNSTSELSVITLPKPDSIITAPETATSILLVEDDSELRASLERLLSERYHVSAASNGADGLVIAQHTNPDLIISDVMMPRMDGFEFCKRIKEDVAISHIPVILLTAKVTGKDQVEGLKSRADAYITKPFNYTVLEAQIESILFNRKRIVDKFRSSPLTQDIHLPVFSHEEKFLENAIRVVTKNIENPEFDVKIFTEQMQVSNSMLYRKLKALTNLSPNEFIRNIRLKTASKLMQERKGNISDIAFSVGFGDAKYFSACFKKEFGVTPSEYMEQPPTSSK